MRRRGFFQATGIGSASLLMGGLPLAVEADEDTIRFDLVSFSAAATIDGVEHQMLLSGSGTFNEDEIQGHGAFNHFDNTSSVPKTILASGAWRAREFVSFTSIGRWGVVTPGILELIVDLLPQRGHRIRDVFMKIVCNAPPGGLLTGEPEGFTLTIPGAPFGTFAPLDPTLGLTLITSVRRHRSD